MKKGRIALLSLLLLVIFGTWYCRIPAVDDELPSEMFDRASQIPTSIPVGTKVLVRAHPERFAETVASVSEVTDDARALTNRALETLLSGRMNPTSEAAVTGFLHHDLDTSAFLAITWGDNEPTLRKVRHGVPLTLEESKLRPWIGRLFLPSDEPKTLAAEIEAFCDRGQEYCRAVERISFEDAFAFVDIAFLDQGWDVDYDPELTIDPEGKLLKRDTPAVRAFKENDVALAAYWKSGMVAEMGALMGLVEIWEALERALPDTHERMQRRGVAILTSALLMESLEAREFEDAAMVQTLHGTAPTAYFVQTHTRRGAEIYEARDRDVEAPQIEIADANIEFEWSGNFAAARQAATTPMWMTNLDPSGQFDDLQRRFEEAGVWAYYSPIFEYPAGAMKGLYEIVEADPKGFAFPLEILGNVVGIRGKFSVDFDRSASFGFELQGGLAVVFDDGPEEVETVVRELKASGMIDKIFPGAVISFDDVGETQILRVGIGEHDEIFGELETLDQYTAVLNLPESFNADGAGTNSIQEAFLSALAPSVDSRVSTREGVVRRLEFGERGDEPLQMPKGSAALIDPEVASPCFQKILQASHRGVRAVGPDDFETLYDGEQLSKAIDRLRQGCDDEEVTDEEAQLIDWIFEGWSGLKLDTDEL